MNPPDPSSGPNSDSSLQFDKAEFSSQEALSCAVCKGPITGEYFQLNNQVACRACTEKVQGHFGSGNGLNRLPIAALAGIGAGIAGFLVYWGIRAATGYEFGLVAILVGWMVGAAVRWGTQARGGIIFQLLAVALTYISISSTYMPDIIEGFRSGGDEPALTTGTNAPAPAPGQPAETPSAQPRSLNAVVLIIAFGIALAAPFLMGFSNIIGLLIIAFGLYQAWIMNRKTAITVAGPYTVHRPA